MMKTKLPLLILILFLNNIHATNASTSASTSLHVVIQQQQQQQQLLPAAFISKISKRRAPIPLSEEMGKSPTLSYKYFDPFKFATEDNFAILREAELKHGRIAMLATIGNVLPDVLRVLADTHGRAADSTFISSIVRAGASASNNNNMNMNMNIMNPQTMDILHLFQDVPCGINAIFTIPFLGWLQILFLIGILEKRVFVQQSPRDMPGDYGTGYFGVRDKARNERSLRSEIENGRLAMVAFVGQVVAELVSGDTALEQIRHTLTLE